MPANKRSVCVRSKLSKWRIESRLPWNEGEYILNRSFPCNLIHHFTICSSLPPPSSFFFLSLFSPYHFFPPSLIFLPIFLLPKQFSSGLLMGSWEGDQADSSHDLEDSASALKPIIRTESRWDLTLTNCCMPWAWSSFEQSTCEKKLRGHH